MFTSFGGLVDFRPGLGPESLLDTLRPETELEPTLCLPDAVLPACTEEDTVPDKPMEPPCSNSSSLLVDSSQWQLEELQLATTTTTQIL